MAGLGEDLPLILRLRLERGISIAELERVTGINHKTIVSYESGAQLKPKTAPLKVLADYFGITVSELYADFHHRRLAQEVLADAA